MKNNGLTIPFIVLMVFIQSVVYAQPFSKLQDLTKSHKGIKSYVLEDLDGDNVKDIVTFSQNDYKISWYKGLDSLKFSEQHIIVSNIFNINNLICTHFNGDTLPDILVNDHDSLYIYPNLGNGNFGNRISWAVPDNYKLLQEIDVDNDGDWDLVGILQENINVIESIYYIENLGSYTFGVPEYIGFNQLSNKVMVKDLDADGYDDLVIGGRRLQLLNNNNGVLSAPVNITTYTYGSWMTSIDIGDIDNDGDYDLAVGGNAYGHYIKVYKNDGDNNFSSNIIFGYIPSFPILEMAIFDVNEDGNKDIVYSSEYGGLYWREQIDTNTFAIPQSISDFSGSQLSITDLNGDGETELITHSSYNVRVSGLSYNLIPQLINHWPYLDKELALTDCRYEDIDLDGLKDLVSLDKDIFWRKNLGNNTFGDINVISRSSFYRPTDMADLDGDGDLDFVNCRELGTGVQFNILENTGNAQFVNLLPIDSAIYPIEDIETGDINGDGLLDIVLFSRDWSSSVILEELVWFENLGNLNFSSKNVITNSLEGPEHIHISDIDNDGDLDILSTSSYDGKLAWYTNLGGGNFSSVQHVFSTDANSLSRIITGDFDLDGDCDVISRLPSGLRFYDNNGSQYFVNSLIEETAQTIDYKPYDINADGYLDIVLVEVNPQKMYWLENLNGTGFSDKKILFESEQLYESWHLGKAEICFDDHGEDGDVDVFIGLDKTNRFSLFENFRNTTYQIDTTVCDSFIFPDSTVTLYTTQTYTDTLVNSTGGDSLLTINLTVKEASYEILNTHICSGDSFNYQNEYLNASVQIIDTLSNICFQDSIIEFNLIVHQELDSIVANICEGDEYQVGYSVYTVSGNYQDTLLNVYGCDSVIHLNLTVNSISEVSIDTTYCSSFTIGDTTYYSSGLYTDTLVNALGCDSIVQLNLTIGETYFFAIDTTICDGVGVNIGTSFYKNAGIYTDTIPSIYQCDSIVQLTLHVIGDDNLTIDTVLCEGDFIEVGSSLYTIAGNYSDSLLNQCGFDSVIHLNLAINPVYSLGIDTILCFGDYITVGGINYNTTGNYTIELINQYNCDSIIALNLEILEESVEEIDVFLCNDDVLLVGESTYTASGTYFDYLIDVNGCDSIITSQVSRTDLSVMPNGGVLTSNQFGGQYQWLSCPNYNLIAGAVNKDYIPEYNGNYAVQVTYNGCIDTSACISINNVSIPNVNSTAFYIVSNPFNGFIQIEIAEPILIKQMLVHNILGQLMFSKTDGFKTDVFIPTENYKEGIYNITIVSQDGTSTFKALKL